MKFYTVKGTTDPIIEIDETDRIEGTSLEVGDRFLLASPRLSEAVLEANEPSEISIRVMPYTSQKIYDIVDEINGNE